MTKPQRVGRQIAISVLMDVVTIEVICGDNYEAQVLYDDLVDRLRSGEGMTLSARPVAPTPPTGKGETT